VTPSDPATFVAANLLAAAALAAYLPVRKAMRVDPVQVLHAEERRPEVLSDRAGANFRGRTSV